MKKSCKQSAQLLHTHRRTMALLFLLVISISEFALGNGNLAVGITPSSDAVITMDGAVGLSCTPSGGCPPYTYLWSFDNASGAPPTDQKDPGDVSFGSGAEGKKNKVKVTVTDDKQATASKEIFVFVPTFEILELTFTTDHGMMTDKSGDSGDGGTAYSEPEWKSAGTNSPISHTRNTNVGVKLKIKLTPSDTPSKSYDSVGDGPTGMNFNTSLTLVGGDNSDKIATSTDKLEDKIYTANESVDWTFKLGGGTSSPSTTGAHKIYALNAAPGGPGPTAWRINWVVNKANGETTPHGALSKIHGGTYTLGATYPSPIWKIADGTAGECIALADFDNAAIQMLGWSAGSIKYLYVKLSKSSKEGANNNDWERRTSDNAKLIFEDKQGGFNNWEAALKYTSGGTTKYYAGGAGIYDSVQDCMDAVTKKSYWLKLAGGMDLAETW